VSRNTSLDLLFAILLLSIPPTKARCLDGINPAFGANPSFFNMSDPVNQDIINQNFSATNTFYYLIRNNFNEAPLFPSIRNYNLLLPFSCPPNGTEILEKNYIHNAWVRAITVMPSIKDEEGNYWVLPNGEVLSAYNYSIQLPRSATNVYPDCGIVYTLLSSSESLSVYADGKYIGSATLVNYSVNSTKLNATAELSVSASVRKDYYVADCYCCESDKNDCEKTCCSCDFSETEVENETAKPSSSLERKVYFLESSPNLTMLQCSNSSLEVASGNFSLVTNVPVQAISIYLGNASFTLYTYGLDVTAVLKPHNVLEANSSQFAHYELQNAFISGYAVSQKLIILNFTSIPQEYPLFHYAGLIVIDLFGIPHDLTNQTLLVCPTTPQISLTVPWFVEKGSNFQVVVKLSESGRGIPNKKVNLYYSGSEFTSTTNSAGEADFSLVANQSTVRAESDYDGKYAEVSATDIAVVYEPSLMSYFLSLLALLFILALSYIGFRFMVRGGR
jgi:hypothetical protein